MDVVTGGADKRDGIGDDRSGEVGVEFVDGRLHGRGGDSPRRGVGDTGGGVSASGGGVAGAEDVLPGAGTAAAVGPGGPRVAEFLGVGIGEVVDLDGDVVEEVADDLGAVERPGVQFQEDALPG